MFPGIHRHFNEDCILLDLDEHLVEPEEFEELTLNRKREFKKSILKVFVDRIDSMGKVSNATKCLKDLCLREFREPTIFGTDLAMPHVRTKQARDFMFGVMRSDRGVWFEQPEGEPIHLIIALVCPPWEDKIYLRFLSALATRLRDENLAQKLLNAEDKREVMDIFCRTPWEVE